MKRVLAIIGAGGHGRVVADAAEQSDQWDTIIFYDDCFTPSKYVDGWSVLGTTDEFIDSSTFHGDCIVGIGDTRKRLELTNRIVGLGRSVVNVFHPHSSVSPKCEIGIGSVVLAGAVVNIGSNLDVGCVVNNNATVNHDCVLAAGVHVGPNSSIGGNVRIGECAWIGIGASIKHGLSIGDHVVVGAGAAVVSDIGNGMTVVGVPAK